MEITLNHWLCSWLMSTSINLSLQNDRDCLESVRRCRYDLPRKSISTWSQRDRSSKILPKIQTRNSNLKGLSVSFFRVLSTIEGTIRVRVGCLLVRGFLQCFSLLIGGTKTGTILDCKSALWDSRDTECAENLDFSTRFYVIPLLSRSK